MAAKIRTPDKPDIIRDFYPYADARARLRPKFERVKALRDLGKLHEAASLLDEIESSALYRRVRSFERTYVHR